MWGAVGPWEILLEVKVLRTWILIRQHARGKWTFMMTCFPQIPPRPVAARDKYVHENVYCPTEKYFLCQNKTQ